MDDKEIEEKILERFRKVKDFDELCLLIAEVIRYSVNEKESEDHGSDGNM